MTYKRTIAYITDIHADEDYPVQHGVDCKANFDRVLQDIKQREIAEVICGGDIGNSSCLPWFFDQLNSFQLAITPGNHDNSKDLVNFYKAELSNQSDLYHCYEDELYKFILLDSSTEKISAEQLNWFEKQLDSEKNIVLFIHHPILAVEGYVDREYHLRGRDEIVERLNQIDKAITVFSGHYHVDYVRQNGNIKQYVSPAVSLQFEKGTQDLVVDNQSFGYRLIHFEDGNINTEVVSFS